MEFLIIAGVFAAFCVVCGYFFLRRTATSVEFDPVIKEILNLAVDQRSTMIVDFDELKTVGGCLSGPCIAVESDGLRMDVSLRREIPEWMGKYAQVSFGIKSKGTSAYYSFAARVCGMPYRAGAHDLLLECPEKIESDQKRRFARVPIPKDVTFGVGMWVLKPEEACPEDPSSLGKALYSYRRDRAEQLALLNLSAGGLRIKVWPREGDESAVMQPGTRLICLVLLRSAERSGDALPFWLDCTITHRQDPAREKMEGTAPITFGLRFQGWAVPGKEKSAVTWFPVGESGSVGPLGAWVLRRQMDQVTQAR